MSPICSNERTERIYLDLICEAERYAAEGEREKAQLLREAAGFTLFNDVPDDKVQSLDQNGNAGDGHDATPGSVEVVPWICGQDATSTAGKLYRQIQKDIRLPGEVVMNDNLQVLSSSSETRSATAEILELIKLFAVIRSVADRQLLIGLARTLARRNLQLSH